MQNPPASLHPNGSKHKILGDSDRGYDADGVFTPWPNRFRPNSGVNDGSGFGVRERPRLGRRAILPNSSRIWPGSASGASE